MVINRKPWWKFVSTLILCASLLLAGCDGSESSTENLLSGSFGPNGIQNGFPGIVSGPIGTGPGTGTPVVFVPGATEGTLVSISAQPSPIALTVGGGSQQITLNGTRDDGTVVTFVSSAQVVIQFTSNTPLVASVSDSGLVSPVSVGNAEVLAEVTTEGTTFSTTVPVTVTATLPPPPPPPPPGNGLLFVSEEAEGGGRVAAYDANTYDFVDSVALGGTPQGLGIDEANLKVFVALRTANQVAVIDATNLGATPNLVSSQGNGPFHVAYDSVHDLIFSPNLGSNNMGIAQADAPFALQGLAAVGRPAEVVIDPTRNVAYVTDNSSGSGINIVSTVAPFATSFVDTTVDGAVPDAVAFGLNRIFVTHHVASDEVVALNADDPSSAPLFRVPSGGADPISVAVDLTRQRLYVANSGSSTITVLNALDGSLINGPIVLAVGAQPRTVIYDSSRDRIIAVNRGTSTISVIDAANLLAPPQTFPVGATPYAAVVAP